MVMMSVLTACGSDEKAEPFSLKSSESGYTNTLNDSAGTNREKLKITSDYLLGTWTSACAADPVRRDIYIKEFLTFDDEGNVNRETTSYLGFKCSVELYQQNLNGKFTFSSSGIYAESRTKVSYIVRSDTGVDIVNKGLCNRKDWRKYDQHDFNDVHQCGIAPALKLSLKGVKDSNSSTLTVTECKSEKFQDCSEMIYTRNY